MTQSINLAESNRDSISPEPGFKETNIPAWRFWMLSIGVCLGLFLAMVDTSIVATSLYTIGTEFDALDDINWVALAYTLAYLGCAIVFSRVSDITGRRNAFIMAYIIFFAFSLGCGFAQTFNQLVACRALQGIGGSGLYSLTMIILPELSPQHLKQHIGALIGMVVAISGVLGPVLGGVLTKYTTWRWVFWINGPIGSVSLAIFFLTWPHADQLPTIERRSWRELDYLGSLLTIAASVLVIFAFQNAGSSHNNGWHTAMFIAPVTIGLLCWIALLVWQHIVGTRFQHRLAPAFPLHLFRSRVYATGVLNTMLLGYPYLMLIFIVPTRIQVVGNKSALIAGVMLLPMLATVALGSIISGKLNSNKNYIFETLLVGSSLMVLACGLLTTLSHNMDDDKLLGFLTFAGLGFGLTVSSSTMIAAIEAPVRDYAPAQGILAQLRIFGGSLGIATSTAVLGEKSSKYLSGVPEYQHFHTMSDGIDSQQFTQQWEAVRLAYTEAFKTDMIVATVVSACATLITIGAYRSKRLDVNDQRRERVQEEISRRQETQPESIEISPLPAVKDGERF